MERYFASAIHLSYHRCHPMNFHGKTTLTWETKNSGEPFMWFPNKHPSEYLRTPIQNCISHKKKKFMQTGPYEQTLLGILSHNDVPSQSCTNQELPFLRVSWSLLVYESAMRSLYWIWYSMMKNKGKGREIAHSGWYTSTLSWSNPTV